MQEQSIQLPLFATEKRCTQCGEPRPLTAFATGSPWCRSCKAEYDRAYRAKNRDRILDGKRSYYQQNRERHREWNRAWKASHRDRHRELNRNYYWRNRDELLERARRWRQEHPESVRRFFLNWRAKHPGIAREYARTRRAKRSGARIERVSYMHVLETHGRVCYLCGQPISDDLEFDHVIPLHRGGDHSEANIRPTHATCNRRKWIKTPDELTWLPDSPPAT